MSCRVVSCRVVSCRVVSCRVVSCRVVSCRVVSCIIRPSIDACVRACVRPCVRSSVRPTVRPPARPPVRPSKIQDLCWPSYVEAISQEGYYILERVQRRAMIQKLRNISYEMRLKECGLTTSETRSMRGDQIEGLKY